MKQETASELPVWAKGRTTEEVIEIERQRLYELTRPFSVPRVSVHWKALERVK